MEACADQRPSLGLLVDFGKGGRRSRDRDRVQRWLLLPEALARERAIGAVLALLVDTCAEGFALLPDPDAMRAHRGYNPTRRGLGVVCFWRVASGRTRI